MPYNVTSLLNVSDVPLSKCFRVIPPSERPSPSTRGRSQSSAVIPGPDLPVLEEVCILSALCMIWTIRGRKRISRRGMPRIQAFVSAVHRECASSPSSDRFDLLPLAFLHWPPQVSLPNHPNAPALSLGAQLSAVRDVSSGAPHGGGDPVIRALVGRWVGHCGRV